ncbi:hypothetical protein GOV07_05405 [Candidatus Woesearchaeota archaeon]|nr:hypothetical protein [Candidatus Woesearchaeota archaeon]
MGKNKRHLTRQEEFDLLKLILDKFLWLGVLIMGYGFWRVISASNDIWYGLIVMLSGAVLLLVFMAILVREYNFMK